MYATLFWAVAGIIKTVFVVLAMIYDSLFGRFHGSWWSMLQVAVATPLGIVAVGLTLQILAGLAIQFGAPTIATAINISDVALASIPDVVTPFIGNTFIPKHAGDSNFKPEATYGDEWHVTTRNNFMGRLYDRYWNTVCTDLKITSEQSGVLLNPCSRLTKCSRMHAELLSKGGPDSGYKAIPKGLLFCTNDDSNYNRVMPLLLQSWTFGTTLVPDFIYGWAGMFLRAFVPTSYAYKPVSYLTDVAKSQTS